MSRQAEQWFESRGWKPQAFQREVWRHLAEGRSGLLHSSTGSGKTLAVWLGLLPHKPEDTGLQVLWITPLRALVNDTAKSLEEASFGWRIELRTGDTSVAARKKQLRDVPEALITTPESLTLMLGMKESDELFANLRLIVVDEWHELMGTKRGVQTELALARIRRLAPQAMTWGLSATLGNTEEAAQVLCPHGAAIVKGPSDKETMIDALLPETIERFPWAGHIGTKMVPEVVEEIRHSDSTLLFTNTRSFAEVWYQKIVEAAPDLEGQIGLHHGSLDREVRVQVENELKEGKLRAVVCTSSLDLGVDFTPVERVMQIGSPKGVARLLQRAGRSGHSPGRPSRVTCVPTHALELLDIAAVRSGAKRGLIEARRPLRAPLDVLAQHLVTIALRGFRAEELKAEVRTSYAYRDMFDEEWQWALDFVTTGGPTLKAYPDYHKVVERDGEYRVESKPIAMRHRMSVGTILSDASMEVRYLRGGRLGSVEESFVSRLQRGDVFSFGGKILEFVRVRDMTCWVRRAASSRGAVPRWMGGRIPLSTELAIALRDKLEEVKQGVADDPEIVAMLPLLKLQESWSAIPGENELLIEKVKTREGFHLFFYPMEGRLVHEGLAAVLATRLSRHSSITFSLACNDYGLELLASQPASLEEGLEAGLFTTDDLLADILMSLNASEMAKRQFREIARIAGLIFQGYPGAPKSTRQVQASSGLLYDVFATYDSGHPLLRQARQEVLERHLEETRLYRCLERLQKSRVVITNPPKPTPFAFPILVDRLRSHVGSEAAETRIHRMLESLEKSAA